MIGLQYLLIGITKIVQHFSAKKLNKLIKEALKIISNHPNSGKPTDKENVQVKVLRDYLIIYQSTEIGIVVLSIWDCTQNPDEINQIIK